MQFLCGWLKKRQPKWTQHLTIAGKLVSTSRNANGTSRKNAPAVDTLSCIAILQCDADGNIAYTPIKTENTTIYIEHEEWPQIDRVHFRSLEDLLEALESNGFKQVPGEMDTVERARSPQPRFPATLQEQLTQPGMFMLDRRYSFQKRTLIDREGSPEPLLRQTTPPGQQQAINRTAGCQADTLLQGLAFGIVQVEQFCALGPFGEVFVAGFQLIDQLFIQCCNPQPDFTGRHFVDGPVSYTHLTLPTIYSV